MQLVQRMEEMDWLQLLGNGVWEAARRKCSVQQVEVRAGVELVKCMF